MLPALAAAAARTARRQRAAQLLTRHWTSLRSPREVLGLAPGYTEDEAKQAYRKLAKELHPDAKPGGGSSSRFLELQQAYTAALADLKDPRRAAAADAAGAAHGAGAAERGAGAQHDQTRQTEAEAATTTANVADLLSGAIGVREYWAPERAAGVGRQLNALREVSYLLAGLIIVGLIVSSLGEDVDKHQAALDEREFAAKRSRLRQQAAEKRNRELEEELARRSGRRREAEGGS